MLSFQYAQYLSGILLLLPLAFIFFLTLRKKNRVKHAIGNPALIDNLIKNYSPKQYYIKFILVTLALALAVISLANLRKPMAGKGSAKAGIDVIIALDVSKSMWSNDVKPSRLEKARQFTGVLIDRLAENRVGLVLFAGQAYLQMPLTSDAVAAKIFLSNASPNAVPVQGTVIAQALQLCNNALDTKEKKYKAVVLISDGEDHDPNADKAANMLADNGVIVYTVGVGSTQGSLIMEPESNNYKTDINGQTVISKLNEKELQNIASKTNGTYFHLGNASEVANEIMSSLDNMDKKLLNDSSVQKQYSSFYAVFLVLALLLIIAETFIPETKKIFT